MFPKLYMKTYQNDFSGFEAVALTTKMITYKFNYLHIKRHLLVFILLLNGTNSDPPKSFKDHTKIVIYNSSMNICAIFVHQIL